MSTSPFDFTSFFPKTLPPAAARWTGRVKFDFTGGNNDSDRLPLEELTAAAEAVLKREGRTMSTYGLTSGPQGYRPLREFLSGKLKADAGINAAADDILITSGSLQALDLVNATLLELRNQSCCAEVSEILVACFAAQSIARLIHRHWAACQCKTPNRASGRNDGCACW